MSEYVPAIRFINTPTVMETWEAENKKEPETHDDKEVKDLSDEYDEKGDVTGTESYYKFAMSLVQTPGTNYLDRSGNEGLWSMVVGGFNAFIGAIGKFFKWVYSFFTSKKEIVSNSAKKLDKAIKVKGVKEGEIPYPKKYVLIWNTTGKPGQDIAWIKERLVDLNTVINSEGKAYIKELKKYISALKEIIEKAKKGQITKVKDDLLKVVSDHASEVKKFMKPGPWMCGTLLEVSNDGKLITKTNTQVAKGVKGIKFKTTVSIVEGVLSAVQHTNDIFGEFTKEVVDMEDVVVADMHECLKKAGELESKNPEMAKAIIDKIKQSITISLTNIKLIETNLYKAINAGLAIASSAVSPEAGESKEDKKDGDDK